MNSWPITVEEFTERYQPSTRQPFSAALSFSIVVHSLALAAVLSLVQWDKLASRPTPSPVIDIALSRATATQDSGVDEEFVAATEAPPAEQLSIPETESIATPVPEPDVAPKPNLPPPRAETSTQDIVPVEVSAQPDDRVLTAPDNDAWQLALALPTPEVPPAIEPQQLPMSEIDQNMLDEQLQEWQDTFELLEQPNQSMTWQRGDQVFHASVEQQQAKNNTDLDRAVVEISTEVDGVRMSTQMAFKRLAFSNYAQVVDRWDRDVAVSEDEIYGRFHSNSRIVVAPERRSEPKFGGKVTIASSLSFQGFGRRADIFLGGLETRVSPIKLPKQLGVGPLDFAEDAEQAVSEYHFDEDGQVQFLASGEFDWQTDERSERHICYPHCFISAGENVELSVEGIINGSVVIFAEDTIRISGNLTYQSHPAENAESTDFLGMLSENYIEIAPPSITGPGDLVVHGALYAKRRFVVRNFRNRNHGAVLKLFGSLTAGSLSATEPRYATRIDFDPRFENQRPPNFPMTNKYELDNWDRQWTVDDN